MVHTYTSHSRPRQTFRTRDGLWHSDMVDIVKDIRQEIGVIVAPRPPDGRIPILFSQLARELEGEREALDLLVQNILAKPILDGFFPNLPLFGMEGNLDELVRLLLPHLRPGLYPLDGFYDMVTNKCLTLDSPGERVAYLTTVFDEFFRLAYPLLSQQHGIFHTPLPIVDFILHSVEHLLALHGGRSLSDPDITILDPFLGTGIFPVRLIEGNILKDEGSIASLGERLQGMEIVRMSARIANLQITHALQEATCRKVGWKGLRIVDTFATCNHRNLLDGLFAEPPLPTQDVIIGNPPWSLTQRHEDDGHRKTTYPELDERIRETYSPGVKGTNKVPLYDSYVRALRWSSDRLAAGGIIGFVINSSFLLGKSVPGVRRALVEEFSHVYVVDLRGDIRGNIQSDWNGGEGQNIFGGRVMTGCALLFLIRKKEGDSAKGRVFYHRMADNLTTTEKRDQLDSWQSIADLDWQELEPDANHDWFRPRSATYRDFMAVAPTRETVGEDTWFQECREPVKPTSEAWCINASSRAVRANMGEFIKVYNDVATGNCRPAAAIKWTDQLEKQARTGKRVNPKKGEIQTVMLHPFVKRYLYHHPDLPLGRGFMHDMGMDCRKNPIDPEKDSGNRLIVPFNGGPQIGFSALMVDVPPVMASGRGNFCLPKSQIPPPIRG